MGWIRRILRQLGASCTSTNYTTTWGAILWRLSSPRNISRHTENLFQDFSTMVFSGWNPTYLRTITSGVRTTSSTLSLHCIIHARVLNRVWGTILQKGGGIVTQRYVPVLQALVQYVLSAYILLVNQSHTPGFVSSSFTCSCFTLSESRILIH